MSSNKLDPAATALVVVDVQEGFNEIAARGAQRNNMGAERNIAALLEAFRTAHAPIIHVRHDSVEPDSPLRADAPGYAVMDFAREREGEPVVVKHVNSAFIGTDLETRLRDGGIEHVVIVGATTNHCVETTTRMAGNLGFAAKLVADATWTFARVGPSGNAYSAAELHDVTLTNLSEEFAQVVTTADVVARLGA
jgi:nicotinamidase-related amidase